MCNELYDSISQVGECPFCIQLFSAFDQSKCQHKKRICKSRLHPSKKIEYCYNAPRSVWSECGYCRWAEHFGREREGDNSGWPGCCRAPSKDEFDTLIDEKDRNVVQERWPIPQRGGN